MSTGNLRLVLANPDLEESDVAQDVEADLKPNLSLVPDKASNNDNISEDDAPAIQRPRGHFDFDQIDQRNPRSRNSLVARIMKPLLDVKPRPKSDIGPQSLSTVEEELKAKFSKPKGRFKVVLVGDLAAKTAQLLITFTYGFKPETYTPILFEEYSMSVSLNGEIWEIVLSDTTGLEDYPHIRNYSYFQADVVIFCYSVVSRKSFTNLERKWLPEVRAGCRSSTYVLTGTNTHLRDDEGTGNHLDLEEDFDLDAIDWDDRPITSAQGYYMAKESQCAGFVECSYFTGKGVDDLFKTATFAFVESRRGRKVPLGPMISERALYSRQFNLGNHANRSKYSIESRSTYFSTTTQWSVVTRGTVESYATASSDVGHGVNKGAVPKAPSPWLQHLDTEKLIRSADEEINWSGKGQHVEFSNESEIPLVPERVLGHSSSALVDSVRCRRVRLARKSIRCSRGWQKKDFLEEVKHLNRLHHAHIIQLVGTYVLGNTLAILLYPVADYTLDAYMDECNSEAEDGVSERRQALERFPLCLARAVDYVHSTNTKHMDIKPTNILICSRPDLEELYMVYVADFGISRNYTDATAMETDGPMAFTRRYCAPEVGMQETRGKSADTFSLGCVFAEIFTVLAGKTTQELLEARRTNSDTTFYNNIEKVLEWVGKITWSSSHLTKQHAYPLIVPELIKGMLQESPQSRPDLKDVEMKLLELDHSLVPGLHLCCLKGPEQYRVAE